jgi:glyoxylase-like metal-dependent hydrolase (beta-lactamase superfamily II)
MRRLVLVLIALCVLAAPARAAKDMPIASWNAPWDEGAGDCSKHPHPPLEVHRYDAETFVLREDLCATWEAPFMYLLIGDKRALLIDTGDVADLHKMPLAYNVFGLMLRSPLNPTRLTVVHTHRHTDHRSGDAQFAMFPKTATIAGYDIDGVKKFYGFKDWPNGIARLDLGNRIVDVIPTPGHNETHIVFYDEKTRLLFSGDFLMPGRLLISDPAAYVASAARVADFVRNKPVAGVLGGHVEMNAVGEVYDWESTYHPHERPLAMTKADVLALPATLAKFNGFYRRIDNFIMIDPMRDLLVAVSAVVLVFLALMTAVILVFKRWRRRQARVGAAS